MMKELILIKQNDYRATHNLSKKYLELYVNEITYRENMREYGNRAILIDLIKHCMNCSPDTNFNGYFQRKNSAITDFKNYDL